MQLSPFDELKARGFVKQVSNEEILKRQLAADKVVFYAGYDATADSLHVGSLVPIMASAHLQRMGHFPVCIIGGGTTMIGDPSGKTEMRKMLTREAVESNGKKILGQLQRFIKLDGNDGLFLNNADWLLNLNYIEFLRDIGRHFKVNEMLRSESYKLRMDRQEGLSFIEFNYQLLQAYDFLVLNERHNCTLQIGGDDQWGNIIAGMDLIRSVNGQRVQAMTFPLLITARGQKMGKTESGAVWLEKEKTSVFDFFQYWLNVDDLDVTKFLKLFTFLPLEEIEKLAELKGADLRAAKEILAMEITKIAHGEEAAKKAILASKAAFNSEGSDTDGIHSSEILRSNLEKGITLAALFLQVGFTKSLSEGNRLAKNGGAYVNGKRVDDGNSVIDVKSIDNGVIMLRHGKKQFHKLIVKRTEKGGGHEY